MKIYIKEHKAHAGRWIYQGYYKAWESLGYDVEFFTNLNEISDKNNFQIMTTDDSIREQDLKTLERCSRAYIFGQPKTFPKPWGSHPNFISMCPESVTQEINKMDNCFVWSWVDDISYHTQWKHVHTIPLAFDSVSYKNLKKSFSYDVCYVGGWADNGFDEKRQIMYRFFKHFKDSGLKCGFFINKNLTHVQENTLLCNSKVCINIHDAHHLTNGFDTNERTFKTLGINGCLVSDRIGIDKETNQITRLFPEVPQVSSPEHMIEKVKELLMLPDDELVTIRDQNKQKILNNHTYIKRVEEFLSL